MIGAARDPLASADRPFSRRGFFRRTLPLGVASMLGLVLLLVAGYDREPSLLALGLAGFAAVWALAYLVPWDRLPRWVELGPPLLLLTLFVGLRNRMDDALGAASLASLFLIPMFWVALFGTPRQLVAFIAVLAAARIGVAIWRGPAADVAHATVAVTIASTVCLLTNQLVTRLRDLERSTRTILEHLPTGFAILQRGEVVYANQRFARSLGHQPDELTGRAAASVIHPDEIPVMNARMARILAGESMEPADRRFLHRDGGEIILETSPVALRIDHEPAVGVVVRDVTDERLLESAETVAHERVETERAQLVAILGAVRDAVAILDTDRRGIYANPAYLELFDLDEKRLAGLSRDEFIAHIATLVDDPADLAQRLSTPKADDDAVFVFVRPRRRVMRRSLRPLELPTGPGFLVVWHDVTSDHELAMERERQAMTDALTGLANRRAADHALERELARARRQGTPLSVALLDIDHFKSINDRFGHEAGDVVLERIAGVLAREARITDTVARWGGEEFLAVLPGDAAGATAFCERVRAALASGPLDEFGRVTLSAGVALVAGTEGVREALRVADARLYDAKRSGRDRVVGEPAEPRAAD